MPDAPFDVTETSTEVERPHAFSIGTAVPGARLFSALDGSLPAEAGWERREYRGVARCLLTTEAPGSRVRLRATGSAFSLIRPPEARAHGHQWRPATGTLACRVDGGRPRELPCEGGDEVLLVAGLPSGAHQLELEAGGAAPARWALEGIRAWPERPIAVSGRIAGGPLLADVRAEVAGPVSFSASLRDGHTGRFAFLVPAAGRYRLDFSAPGWDPASSAFDAPAGGSVELPAVTMREHSPAQAPARALAPDEPLVLVACAHCNIWGTEPAEWLARRVGWINAQRPHAMLLANEVNPGYVAGALRGLACPWVITDGNHRHPAFGQWPGEAHGQAQVGPARIVTAGLEVAGDSWRGVFGRFAPGDSLRVVCAYEPFAPPELLEEAGVRLYFYGHDLSRPPYWTRGRTVFLRKVDSQTFYRIEIGPPHDAAAPIKVRRLVFSRAE